MMRRLLARCLRGCVHPSLRHAIQGCLLAVCLATVCQQVVALLGTSVPVSLSLVMSIVAGLALGIATPTNAVPRSTVLFRAALLQLGMTAWMVATPSWLSATDSLIAHPSVLEPATNGHNLWILTAVCLVLVGIPAAACGRLGTWTSAGGEGTANRVASLLIGSAAGLTLWGFGLAQLLGPYFCGVGSAGIGLAILVWQLLRSPDALPTDAAADRANGSPADLVDSTTSPSSAISRWWHRLLDGAIVACCGGLLAGMSRILEQLIPGTVYLVCSEAVGLVAGLGLGMWLAQRLSRRRWNAHRTSLLLCTGLSVCGVTWLAAYPLVVQWMLWSNAHISSTWLLLGVRGLAAALPVLAVGIVVGACLVQFDSREAGPITGRARWWLICAAVGFCAMAPAGDRGISPEDAVVAMAWSIAGIAVLRYGRWAMVDAANRRVDSIGRHDGGEPRRSLWLARGTCAAGLVAVAVVPNWRGNCDPRLSARLLFSTKVFIGHNLGFAADILPFLDEGRHVATIHGGRGTTTVWKYCGRQLQIRENGLPAGVVSCDPDVLPRFLPETLQAALPLVLHTKPQSMLVLGLGSGEALLTGLAFPLPEISCWEPDASRVQVLRSVVAEHCGFSPLDDDRVRLTVADPILALDAEPGTFDAIVSTPDHSALLRAQPTFTQAFYRRVSRRLTPNGVFCQRLQFVDLGPRPVQAIVCTLQSVFRDVLALEVAPGEMLLAATNDPTGLLHARLIKRLQLPHVRGLLAQSGLDWTVVLNLTAFRHEDLEAFVAEGHVRPNLSDNDRLVFAMPREVMRWAPKLQEVHTALAPHAGRILTWIGDEGSSKMLVRRLSEVTGQQNLMANYSEQYWSYRATLRTQLTQKPRSEIQQASATDEPKQLHSEDQKRLRYFLALDRATKSAAAADIQQLERFEFPYDPLVSYFLHLEAAELLARSPERNYRQELRHRLHALWFSSPRDTSLRNVVAALRLLRDYHGAEPDPVRRWDTLNSLLQTLQHRWEARAGVKPTNVKKVVEDIDATLQAADQTFSTMEKLTADAHLPPEIWSARKRVLEKTLISPVKSYRSDILPHLHSKLAKSSESTDDSPSDAVDEAGVKRDEVPGGDDGAKRASEQTSP